MLCRALTQGQEKAHQITVAVSCVPGHSIETCSSELSSKASFNAVNPPSALFWIKERSLQTCACLFLLEVHSRLSWYGRGPGCCIDKKALIHPSATDGLSRCQGGCCGSRPGCRDLPIGVCSSVPLIPSSYSPCCWQCQCKTFPLHLCSLLEVPAQQCCALHPTCASSGVRQPSRAPCPHSCATLQGCLTSQGFTNTIHIFSGGERRSVGTGPSPLPCFPPGRLVSKARFSVMLSSSFR